jgi:glutamate synthase (NADPH/NADH) large chain
MKSAADVIKMICLGANRVGFGTMAMVAIGCTICRRCQTDTCHVGIATQLETPEEAAARGVRHFSPRDFEIAVENLCRFFKAMGEEIRVLTASLGAQRTQDLVGRGDLLIQARAHDRLDLRDLLTPVYMDKEPPLVAQRIVRRPRNYLTKTITDLVTNAVGMGDHIVSFFDDHLDATDRALGTHLAGELVRQIGADHAARQMQADVERVTLTFDSASVPGNGLAAFLSDPLRVVVEGGAQDGVAKGAMGGVVAILKGMNHHGERLDGSVGKSFAYGAQRGLFIVQGDADSRACIRLSGADVVFGGRIRERVDDQGGGLAARANLKGFAFEYMTAGRVLVLGDPGPWICAGMTGGVVYLRLQPELGFDVAAVQRRIARGAKVRLARVNLQDGEVIRSLLHAYATVLRESDQEGEAQQVEAMLIDWNERFIKVVPASQVVDQEISTE